MAQEHTRSPDSLIATADLWLAVAGKPLLDGASFALQPGRRVALVGRNGSGKSTLLATLGSMAAAGRPPEHVELRGRLTFAPGTIVTALPQSPQLAFAGTAHAYLDACAGEVSAAWNRHEELSRALADSGTDERLLQQYGDALDTMQRLDAWDYPQRVVAVTAGLGLPSGLLGQRLTALSGGQATRLALAGVLLARGDVLLLDEPSNNLDVSSIRFLIAWIRASTAALVLVSHDRELIDATVDEVLEIEEHTRRLRLYGGGYTAYAERKREEREAQARRYTDQVERRAQLEASAREVSARSQRMQSTSQNDFYRSKAVRVARLARAQRTRIERELSRVPEPEPPALPRLTVPAPAGREGLLLKATGIGHRFGATAVLRGVDLQVRHRDRIALVGPNGSGKSTLLRILTGELAPTWGVVERASGLRVAHLPQTPALEDSGASLLDFALRRFPGPREQLRVILGKVLFADPAGIRTSDVSLGELRRVECAALFASAPDLAALDEPTNHLDLLSVEMLEAALGEYAGALVVVSHDVRLLEALLPTATHSLPLP